VADCLLEKTYQAGEYVIRQDEQGENFFIVVDGEAVATKKLPNQSDAQEVMRYRRGDYFGELALLNDQVRFCIN
jgi:CRP-like cAMP-binding protein